MFSFQADSTFAQQVDTLPDQALKEFTIRAFRFPFQENQQLPPTSTALITAGKKSEVIIVQDLPANLSEKTGRQVFAKIPGAFVYDMDGSGNQVNLSTRGLDPHRSWELNTRQNGVMTNSDIYGYPASHYSPPMEAIQRIEIVRGTASLQYGSQFGGLINYITKRADTTRQFGFESQNSIGSFGLFSTFNAAGGRMGRLTYHAYSQRRVSEGYRDNARSDAQAQFASLTFEASSRLRLRAELGRSQYLFRIPGPQTDSMFQANPRQATRSRNYFSPDIYVPSLTLDWQINRSTRLEWTTSAVLGTRSSVQFIGFADAVDAIDPTTLQYKSRQVDIDHFDSRTTEIRLRRDFQLGKISNTLVGGTRLILNDLHRQQLGKGTTGSGFDLALTSPAFGRDLHFKTQNIAFFAENLFHLTKKWSATVGFRLENGMSRVRGVVAYLPDEKVPFDLRHRFPLFGASSEWRANEHLKFYGGWSQAYRPVIFADLIPGSVLERNDPDLRDVVGHNAELGLKGKLFGRLNFDLSFFEILYKNRIGTQVLTDAAGQSYLWKTNFGDSRTLGAELYAEYRVSESKTHRLSVFTASSFFEGKYLHGNIRNGSENNDLTGNRLETLPRWISRNGLQMGWRRLTGILQFSYVSESFSDALNTFEPSANGARGIVPTYSIWDLNCSWRVSQKVAFKFGINNLTDEQYFTKRPTGYPGQGVWASDGRSVVGSVTLRI